MFEVIRMESKKTPLAIEVEVPPKCSPILVGNPKTDSLLRWVESPSRRGTVMSWGFPVKDAPILKEVLNMTLERSQSEGWGVIQGSLQLATERLKDLGIEEVESTNQVVHPKDPTLLGSLIIIGDMCFPVIHNARRALSVINPNT